MGEPSPADAVIQHEVGPSPPDFLTASAQCPHSHTSRWESSAAVKPRHHPSRTPQFTGKNPRSTGGRNRPVTLSEFGGYSLKVSGHVFNEDKFFGYKKFKTQEEFVDALKKLYNKKLLPLIAKGLSAAIYTQVSDVEEEINGLVTYDRKVVKISVEEMKALNEKLYKEAERLN